MSEMLEVEENVRVFRIKNVYAVFVRAKIED